MHVSGGQFVVPAYFARSSASPESEAPSKTSGDLLMMKGLSPPASLVSFIAFFST